MPAALLSVSNKEGLVEFTRELTDLGWNLLASGGTASTLRSAGIAVEDVAQYTGSPEILGGRVKTLHPAVHGGILARDTAEDNADLDQIHARRIDLVAVNLYPFRSVAGQAGVRLEEAIENIDIGGVALLRAAAKNSQRVTVLCDPVDYPLVLDDLRASGQVSAQARARLAVKAFRHTADYDDAIARFLAKSAGEPADSESPVGPSADLFQGEAVPLRYGENPHQAARLYLMPGAGGPLGGEVLQGKALSYNNLLDLDAAWRAALSFGGDPVVAIVKHLSPCGIARAHTTAEAFSRALHSDPVSAFGGVIAASAPVDGETVQTMGSLFVECIIAPDFTSDALEMLARRKNCRLVRAPDMRLFPDYELRTVNGGILWQGRDFGDPPAAPEWQVVTRRAPTAEEWSALRFAWVACQHVKSNAIVLASGEATVGIGGGQPNRVDCVRIAIQRAGERARGAVMASDAFFPFADSVEAAAAAGVTAIVQPGGSMRDAESIQAADAFNIAMLITGVRHFRH